MNHYMKCQRSAVVHKLNPAVGHPLMHFYANAESLHRCLEGIVSCSYFSLLVFRQHALEVLQVCKSHVHLVRLTGNYSVLAFYFCHIIHNSNFYYLSITFFYLLPVFLLSLQGVGPVLWGHRPFSLTPYNGDLRPEP